MPGSLLHHVFHEAVSAGHLQPSAVPLGSENVLPRLRREPFHDILLTGRVAGGASRPHWKLGAHACAASFFGTSFTADANADATDAPEDAATDPTASDADPDAAAASEEGKNPGLDYPGWTNTEGLPAVVLVTRNEKYYSPDMATAEGEGSFKPTFGCKCGYQLPAPAHPTIKFRQDFLQSNPGIVDRMQKLKVHMEDDAGGKVYWDATYDLKRYLSKEDLKKVKSGAGTALQEWMPADRGSGTQMRFLTFCPPEGKAGDALHPAEKGQTHEYTLKVTAIDQNDEVIKEFNEEVSRFAATGAAPEEQTPPQEAQGAAEPQQPIVGVAKVGPGPATA